MTVDKIVADEPLPNLVQTKISVAPYGKVLAEKPSEAAEKSTKEVEDDRLAELARVAEVEKLSVVLQQVEKNKRAEAAVAANAELDMAQAAEREQVAKAKADADINAATEDAEDDFPLSRRTKASAAVRKPLRKRNFVLTAPHLDDDIPEDAEKEAEDVNDEENLHMDDDDEFLNDDGVPIVETLSDDSSPQHEDPQTVLEGAQVFAHNVDNEHFIDDVLLGQDISTERNRNASEVIDRMAYIYVEPLASYDPNASENVLFSTPEAAPTSTHDQVLQ
ncbi:hypothetical protein M5689_024716 [Euphorbia peplus]|nr:hypothetical protein M5689_024716 [Euphorbia peplus]